MGLLSRSRRRHWLVDRKQQLPFVAGLVVQTLFASTLMGLAMFVLNVRVTARILAFVSRQDALPFADDVSGASRGFLLQIAVLLLVSAIGIALFGLKASNRLAGPALRLRRVFVELSAGDASQRVAFRRKDRIDDLSEALNKRLQRLNDGQNRLKSDIPFLASALQTCHTDIELGKFPLDADELRRLEGTLRALAGSWQEIAATRTQQQQPS